MAQSFHKETLLFCLFFGYPVDPIYSCSYDKCLSRNWQSTHALLPSTAMRVAFCRSSSLTPPLRQLSAKDSDMGSGKISSSPFSTPSKSACATDSGEAFGMSRDRDISVSIGPGSTAYTPTPCPANKARSDCVRLNAAAFAIE